MLMTKPPKRSASAAKMTFQKKGKSGGSFASDPKVVANELEKQQASSDADLLKKKIVETISSLNVSQLRQLIGDVPITPEEVIGGNGTATIEEKKEVTPGSGVTAPAQYHVDLEFTIEKASPEEVEKAMGVRARSPLNKHLDTMEIGDAIKVKGESDKIHARIHAFAHIAKKKFTVRKISATELIAVRSE